MSTRSGGKLSKTRTYMTLRARRYIILGFRTSGLVTIIANSIWFPGWCIMGRESAFIYQDIGSKADRRGSFAGQRKRAVWRVVQHL